MNSAKVRAVSQVPDTSLGSPGKFNKCLWNDIWGGGGGSRGEVTMVDTTGLLEMNWYPECPQEAHLLMGRVLCWAAWVLGVWETYL